MVGCGVMAVSLSACESTQRESEKIGREAARTSTGAASLKLGAPNRGVRVSQVTLLSAGGRKAVALRLTSTSARAQADVPVEVSVSGKGGKVLYSNATGEQESSLQHVALLRPAQSVWWVDDQVLTSQPTTGVKVSIGTGQMPPAGALAQLGTSGVQRSEQGGIAEVSGNLVNHSHSAQSKVAVFVVSLSGGRVRAAGRAVVAALAGQPGASAPFQAFLVGKPAGSIQLSPVPSAG